MWLIASVCFIGFTATVKQQAELVIKSVDKNHQNINTHRFSLCEVVEKPVRIKIHQRSSRLQLKHDAAGDLSVAFSSDVHRTLEYKLTPDQWREINTTSEFSLHDHAWFSLWTSKILYGVICRAADFFFTIRAVVLFRTPRALRPVSARFVISSVTPAV